MKTSPPKSDKFYPYLKTGDAAANLVSSDHRGGFVEHNRLKMFEDKRFEYDVYGRLVRKLSGHGPAKELVLEYDDWNQLTAVVPKDRLGVATTHFTT
ncbi:hypothetical protein [Burkholderia sp. Ac-20349]|uniref:hypothetical protein n=1 Tax=Burkholderia sp. Ac-20349 TaxID=2703893 RepID=UPI00197C3604|nr:hypothetical protein [Burkholderia sp. Ac-20349]MBN3842253.1 hypothetical protein [Burkholderia sp. Ac-20349]